MASPTYKRHFNITLLIRIVFDIGERRLNGRDTLGSAPPAAVAEGGVPRSATGRGVRRPGPASVADDADDPSPPARVESRQVDARVRARPAREPRSEERRVGKECRSRGSP